MTETKTYRQIAVYQYDPTKTLMLRNAFARDMKQRFGELTKIIYKAIVDEDVFGLKQFKTVSHFTTQQMQTPGQGAFSFSRNELKLAQFMKWLQEQVEKGIIDVQDLQQVGVGIEGAWTNKYIFDSYKRGIIRARYELQKAGYKVPSIDDTGGIEVSMSTPFHLDRLGLLFTRVYSELQGITAAMDSQISRILAQGIADGDNPRLLARKLVSTINGSGMGDLSITDSLGRFIPAERRAEMLARTEIIRGHHLASIQEYRNWAVEGVIVQAEVVTAGDNRVCSKCEALEKGGPYTLDAVEKLIPFHPNCRCCAIPIVI